MIVLLIGFFPGLNFYSQAVIPEFMQIPKPDSSGICLPSSIYMD